MRGGGADCRCGASVPVRAVASAALAGGDQRADLRRTVLPKVLESCGRQHQAASAASHAGGAQEVPGCRPSLKRKGRPRCTSRARRLSKPFLTESFLIKLRTMDYSQNVAGFS